MKIIYNEEEAKKKKEEIDREDKEERRRVERRNWRILLITLAISAVIIIPSIFVLASVINIHDDEFVNSLAGAVGVAFGCIPAGLGFLLQEEFWGNEYPSDVEYFRATNGYKILERCVDGHTVYVTRENAEGDVDEIMVCVLTEKLNTRVSEKTADLPNGVLLIPYTIDDREEGEGKNEN